MLAFSDAMRYVAGQRQRESRRQAMPVDRGDDRLPHVLRLELRTRRQHLLAPLLRRPIVLRRARRPRREVSPGAKRALPRPRHDRDPQVRVVSELGPDLAQAQHHLRIQRVQLLRPVQGDEGNLPPALEVHGHGIPPGCGWLRPHCKPPSRLASPSSVIPLSLASLVICRGAACRSGHSHPNDPVLHIANSSRRICRGAACCARGAPSDSTAPLAHNGPACIPNPGPITRTGLITRTKPRRARRSIVGAQRAAPATPRHYTLPLTTFMLTPSRVSSDAHHALHLPRPRNTVTLVNNQTDPPNDGPPRAQHAAPLTLPPGSDYNRPRDILAQPPDSPSTRLRLHFARFILHHHLHRPKGAALPRLALQVPGRGCVALLARPSSARRPRRLCRHA